MIQNQYEITDRILRESLHYVVSNLHETTPKITWQSVQFYTEEQLEFFRKEARVFSILSVLFFPAVIMSLFLSFADISADIVDANPALLHLVTVQMIVIELSILWQAKNNKRMFERGYLLIQYTLDFEWKKLETKLADGRYDAVKFKRMTALPDVLPLPSHATAREKTLQNEIYNKIQKITNLPITPYSYN